MIDVGRLDQSSMVESEFSELGIYRRPEISEFPMREPQSVSKSMRATQLRKVNEESGFAPLVRTG